MKKIYPGRLLLINDEKAVVRRVNGEKEIRILFTSTREEMIINRMEYEKGISDYSKLA